MSVQTRLLFCGVIVSLAFAASAIAAEEETPLPRALPVGEPVAPAAPVAGAEPVEAEAKPEASGAGSAMSAAAPLLVTVQLNIGNTELRGTLLSAPEFTMKTSFGELAIPMTRVAGIKLASHGNTSTTVVMHNGDSITGAWDLDHIQLQTEWGSASVDGSAINSILFTPDMAWVSEKTLSGTRWELMAKPEGSEAAPTPAGDLKPGDIIVVRRDSDLRTGTNVVGNVKQEEVLVIKGVLDSFYYVDTGKVAGWISKENVSPYRDPGAGGAASDATATAKAERTADSE